MSATTVSFEDEGLRLDTSEDAQVICSELEKYDNVEILKLQGNTFGIEAAERVGLELANHPTLKEAHFKDLFTSRGREEVPVAMKHLLRGICDSGARLTFLDLSDNAIGPIGAPSVIEFLESSSSETLETLLLNNNGLGPEGSTSVASTLPRLKSLRKFICGRNRLENKGATNMSRALLELDNLEILNFKQNGINVEGIKELAKVLEKNKNTIREIDLSDNTIKTEGSKALADALSKSTNLESIYLNDALLMNAGFVEICKGLAECPSLSTTLQEAFFEGNELSGSKIIDSIESYFSGCHKDFVLNLLENEFTRNQLIRLESMNFRVLVDDPDSDEDDDNHNDNDIHNGNHYDDYDDSSKHESNANESDVSNSYVDIGSERRSEIREVSQDFIRSFETTTTTKPFDLQETEKAFMELVLTGTMNGPVNYQAVQILCEELGLVKPEATGKKKPLQRDAIVYLVKRLNELPPEMRDFFEVTVKDIEKFKI